MTINIVRFWWIEMTFLSAAWLAASAEHLEALEEWV
jgi:hypothetical protein